MKQCYMTRIGSYLNSAGGGVTILSKSILSTTFYQPSNKDILLYCTSYTCVCILAEGGESPPSWTSHLTRQPPPLHHARSLPKPSLAIDITEPMTDPTITNKPRTPSLPTHASQPPATTATTKPRNTTRTVLLATNERTQYQQYRCRLPP